MSSHRVIKDRSPSRLMDFIAMLFALQVVFIGGQLAGVLHWSWWYVFYPTILPVAFVLGVIAFGSVGAGFIALFIALISRGAPEVEEQQSIASDPDEFWYGR